MTDDPRAAGSHSTHGRGAAGDPELIVAARAGDGAAFLELRRRHEAAAFRLASLLVGAGEATVVTERAFDRARRTLESGGGPDCAFRLQILRDVRTAVTATGTTPVDVVRPADAVPSGDTPAGDGSAVGPARAEADPAVRRSFLALPERWGSVLWHTDVEQQTDAEVALLLGMKAATVTGLAARSREGLVRGYLAGQVHQLEDSACAQILDRLADSVAASADRGPDASVQEHLDGCDGCRRAARTLTVLVDDLGAALAVVVLGEQGIPYLEAAERAAPRAGVVAARVPARPRSMRVVLVAVALVAVTASVPALRAGADSEARADSLTAAVFDPSADRAAAAAPTAAAASSIDVASTTAGVADADRTTTAPGGTTTITTTGANGFPTRVGVSTTTTVGVDGVPTTVAVIPGVSGSPATTVTGSFPSDGSPVFGPWTTDSTAGSPAGTTGPGPDGSSTWSGTPTAATSQYTPPLFATDVPQQTSDPGTTAPWATVPGTTRPGTTAPWTTVPGTTVQGTTVQGTTPQQTTVQATTTPGTTATATTEPAVPLPGTTAVPTTPTPADPPAQTTTSTPTSDDPPPPTEDPTTTSRDETTTVSPPPTPDVEVRGPALWVVTLVGALPVDSPLTVVNRTGAAIPAQRLTVTLPEGIDVAADGAASGCARQDATTWTCTVDALSASDDQHSITLTLTGGGGADSGPITVSVTDDEASGQILSVL